MSFTAVIIALGLAFGLLTIGIPALKSAHALLRLLFSRSGLVVIALVLLATGALFVKGVL